ncbi:peptidase inhibitor family I36 protein [Streptomyces lincolnensis]|uniref:peptidase inhibitor family I36 protein n=1 Tax=Streptomyces lincolnensis TaxID=1915 RepID=UPI001E46438B|nr:peptidase inhibitor family I36 protein [Streptomyces lincolnensis]MCD7444625.1 peptidase inhibitor family I36 protein [Streptomyces lincolnensis]
MRKKLAAVVGASALCLSLAPLAQASSGGAGAPAPGPDVAASCPAGYACFWPGKNFAGNRGQVAGNNPNFRELHNSQQSCGSRGWEDCVSSIRNSGRECTVYFYSNRNYNKSGRWHSLSRGDEVPDFGRPSPVGYDDPGFDNTISSNKWCSS